MYRQDIVRALLSGGITKTGSEQEQVDRLADALDGLLAFREASRLRGYMEYDLVRHNARRDTFEKTRGGAGVSTLTGALINLSIDLLNRCRDA